MAKKPNSSKRLIFSVKILAASLFLAVFLLSIQLYFLDKIYPGISIASVALGGQTRDKAKDQVLQTVDQRMQTSLIFKYQGQQYELILSSEDIIIGLQPALEKAFVFGHSMFYYSPQQISLNFKFTQSFDNKLDKIVQGVDEVPVNSQIKIADDNQINVTPSQNGLTLDREELKKIVSEYLNTGTLASSSLPTETTYPKLSYDTALEIKKTLDQIKLNPTTLHFENQAWILNLEKVLSLIDLSSAQPSLFSTSILDQPVNPSLDNTLNLNPAKLKKFLNDIALQINRNVQEPLFQFEGGKVTEFRPAVDGRRLKITETAILINNALVSQNQKDIELPVEIIPPENKLTNDLGIKELIGQGVSNFAGSIANRVFNIGLATSRINGILVKPGEIFSFNKTVGDISAESGYKQAYVIKEGRTVLDDGGGVCQVSTTLFRAVLNAGLPVIARTAHAYRVSYYEQGFPPGLDATIFAPSVDFKFKNNTEHHVLIQAYVRGNSLYIEFYGTSDGRVVKLSKPTIADQTPPPPELRQDDPMLPKGEVKQVDWPAWGATVLFSRTVTRNGETIISETFKSNYHPWQAVYLVGTKEN